MNKKNKSILGLALSLLAFMVLVTSCASVNTQNSAVATSIANGANASYYIPKNGVELRNYNWRQQVSDDPSAILWCTSAFPMSNVPLITVPIIGKLTSGSKRPFPTTVETASVTTGSNEIPGSDNMYGSSTDYRYGFGPTGMNEYYDFYNLPTFCTTQPTVWQAQNTALVQTKDENLSNATIAAHQALVNGDTVKAAQILNDAIKKSQVK